MLDAGNKAGAVPHNLEHAKLILGDNVFAYTPADDSTKRFAAFDHLPVPDKRSYTSVGALIMARTMQRFAAEHPDLAPALMTAIAAGVSEIALPSTIGPAAPTAGA